MPAVETNRPLIDRVDDEVRLAPRITGECRSDAVFGSGLEDENDSLLVGEWAAEDHDPVIDTTKYDTSSFVPRMQCRYAGVPVTATMMFSMCTEPQIRAPRLGHAPDFFRAGSLSSR